jgi:wyosine [tRNA(Phe)-imidazoG37] synthetase (radical SAM superfamily)
LGRSVPLTNKREEYFPRRSILAEVEKALSNHKPGEIDWITFVGSGEPSLHIGLGWLIKEVKALTNLPVAVITNGSLLKKSDVRFDLRRADAVLPSLDAGDQRLYRKINRPWPRLTYERLLNGLVAFRKEYCGLLWIEVMLVQGLNDSEAALEKIAQALDKILPDEVHINLPTRPPAETWVKPPSEAVLRRAAEVFGDIATVVQPVEGVFDTSDNGDVAEAILSIIARHPMRESELRDMLQRWNTKQVEAALADLLADGQAQVVERHGSRFWSVAVARYAKI